MMKRLKIRMKVSKSISYKSILKVLLLCAASSFPFGKSFTFQVPNHCIHPHRNENSRKRNFLLSYPFAAFISLSCQLKILFFSFFPRLLRSWKRRRRGKVCLINFKLTIPFSFSLLVPFLLPLYVKNNFSFNCEQNNFFLLFLVRASVSQWSCFPQLPQVCSDVVYHDTFDSQPSLDLFSASSWRWRPNRPPTSYQFACMPVINSILH